MSMLECGTTSVLGVWLHIIAMQGAGSALSAQAGGEPCNCPQLPRRTREDAVIMSQRGSGCARFKLLGEYVAMHGLGVAVVRPEESHSDVARGIGHNTTKRVRMSMSLCATIDGSDASLWSTILDRIALFIAAQPEGDLNLSCGRRRREDAVCRTRRRREEQFREDTRRGERVPCEEVPQYSASRSVGSVARGGYTNNQACPGCSAPPSENQICRGRFADET